MSSHVQPCSAISSHIQPCPVMSSHAQSYPVMSHYIQSYPAMSSHAQPCPAMFSHTQPCPTISRHVQPCSALHKVLGVELRSSCLQSKPLTGYIISLATGFLCTGLFLTIVGIPSLQGCDSSTPGSVYTRTPSPELPDFRLIDVFNLSIAKSFET